MNSNEIRETYLSFFEGKEHERRPSASLVPPSDDTSVLLTTAGMQPFKSYFRGQEPPPHPRLTSSQRCFRTVDIDVVGTTKRHLTFFEMLGNFSFGDYFKAEAIEFAHELSLEGLGLDRDRIWATVFAGDDELGLEADAEAIELWRARGISEERIVRLPRSENFWQAGPTGPCGPSSELYFDRGPEFGSDDDRPGDDTDRYLEYWNLVFMAYELAEDGSISDLPQRGIDTGLGLERQAAILQGVDSVFDTDILRPLVSLAEELSGVAYESSPEATRAMRILADHSRGTVNLIADGVVPSNEERGYVLRRIMRRAIQQGRVLGLEAPYLGRFAERVIELMGETYPHLADRREAVMSWVGDEEESFGRTLDRGTELLARIVAEAKEAGTASIEASQAFLLHDTYGFPYDLTRELLAEEGLAVDDAGFQELMEEQRERARAGSNGGGGDGREAVLAFAREAPPTSFVGYESLSAQTSVVAAQPAGGDGDALVKLEESPFYAEGGGQVADSGVLRWDGGEASVAGVYRIGEDQTLRTDGGSPEAGMPVEAIVDHEARYATMRNHTATHLLHAALRERLGDHVRQAGSAVRPDKLRFDFTHGAALSSEELREVEDRVNGWVKASRPVRAMQMERAEAEALGAMALFGEKYGDWVRVVEVDDVSRELCGGTHVANTAEVGIFTVVGEGSSAANVRRIEALTGPAAIDWFRSRSAQLDEAGAVLGSPQDPLAGARRASERLKALERQAAEAGKLQAGEAAGELAAAAGVIGDVKVVATRVDGLDGPALLDLADRVKAKLGEAAVILGAEADGKGLLAASFTKAVVERGPRAGAVVREAAAVMGGGGGGRDDAAQAGGGDPAKLDDTLAAARPPIAAALGS
ncbi:MAG: alanine--tRNA ligase [Solirubrobacterales bacterium]